MISRRSLLNSFASLGAVAMAQANGAKKAILVHMAGAPSHTDTFDLKVGPWTPRSFEPTSYANGAIRWPKGLMPRLAEQLDSIALVRSVRASGETHGMARKWMEPLVSVTMEGWDDHQNIYSPGQLPLRCDRFDRQFAGLIVDLKASGSLDSTLIVAMGEFGRMGGPLNHGSGRDHCAQHTVLFAGGGIKGGRVIGRTDGWGASTVDYGWSQKRDVGPEDIAATIEAFMGVGTRLSTGCALMELWDQTNLFS